MTGASRRGRRAVEGGFAAGAEALVFGVLVLVVGTLLVVNAWAVIDARFAVAAAAREAVRAAVEAPDARTADADGRAAAEVALRGHGTDPSRARFGWGPDGREALSTLVRCDEVAATVTVRVPALVLPGIERRVAAFEVQGTHREVVDAFSSGLPGAAACGF